MKISEKTTDWDLIFATDFILLALTSQTATYEYFGTYPAYELLAYVRGGLLCSKNANPRVTEFSLTLGLAVFFDFRFFRDPLPDMRTPRSTQTCIYCNIDLHDLE